MVIPALTLAYLQRLVNTLNDKNTTYKSASDALLANTDPSQTATLQAAVDAAKATAIDSAEDVESQVEEICYGLQD